MPPLPETLHRMTATLRRAPRGPLRARPALLVAAALLAACSTLPDRPDRPGQGVSATIPDPSAAAAALADAMRTRRVVLLGEVHDNAAQHALRAAALARLVAAGARPAIAFEQFDRERQAGIDRARRERPRDPDWLIAQAGGASAGWDWPLYRPYVALALEHDLPIIAANLSRTDASRVVREGFGAVFDPPTRAALGLDDLPADLLAAHRREVADGHCGLLPEAMLTPMARAQVARDAVLAASIAPHAARGVVLLTGNGHARKDLGVARWLPASVRAEVLAIGLLEPAARAALPADAFDRVVDTPAQSREDPCEGLRARMTGRGAPGGGRSQPAPSPATSPAAPTAPAAR